MKSNNFVLRIFATALSSILILIFIELKLFLRISSDFQKVAVIFNYLFLVCFIIGIVVGFIWQKNKNDQSILTDKWFYMAELTIRYTLAAILSWYAFGKFVGTQFSTSYITTDTPLREIHPQVFTWYFFGFSRIYAYFIGLSQLAACVLLLFRRTYLFGAFILVGFMGNVAVLNYTHHIPVLLVASLFLSGALFLVLVQGKNVFNFFYKQISTTPRAYPTYFLNNNNKFEKIFCIVGIFTILYSLGEVIYSKNKKYRTTELCGIWNVTSNDTIVLRNDYKLFPKKIYFEKEIWMGENDLEIKQKNDSLLYNGYTIDEKNKKITMSFWMKLESEKPDSTITFAYKLSGDNLKIENDKIKIIATKSK